MTQEQRIRLARERQAYKKSLIPLAQAMWPDTEIFHLQAGQDDGGYVGYNLPNGTFQSFDPKHNANDAEQLIAYLMTQGWYVEIEFQTYEEPRDYVDVMSVMIHIWHIETERHERRDCALNSWKTGLVELAMKIVGEGE